jgi:hypothetical protein
MVFNPKQKRLERLLKQVSKWEQEILNWANELNEVIIEKEMSKSDLKLGIQKFKKTD